MYILKYKELSIIVSRKQTVNKCLLSEFNESAKLKNLNIYTQVTFHQITDVNTLTMYKGSSIKILLTTRPLRKGSIPRMPPAANTIQ